MATLKELYEHHAAAALSRGIPRVTLTVRVSKWGCRAYVTGKRGTELVYLADFIVDEGASYVKCK